MRVRFALAEATLETESAWARKTRVLTGGLGVGLGAAAVLAAAPGDMDPTLRGLYTRSLLGAGIGAIGVGLAKLFIPSALERSYVSFEHGTHSTSFRLVPLAGGNTLSFGAAF